MQYVIIGDLLNDYRATYAVLIYDLILSSVVFTPAILNKTLETLKTNLIVEKLLDIVIRALLYECIYRAYTFLSATFHSEEDIISVEDKFRIHITQYLE